MTDDLVEWLRRAAANIERARTWGVTEHLAGWEPRQIREAAARILELEEALDQIERWVGEFSTADLDEIAADGGITVGMVFQQEAVERGRRIALGPKS